MVALQKTQGFGVLPERYVSRKYLTTVFSYCSETSKTRYSSPMSFASLSAVAMSSASPAPKHASRVPPL